jgi:aminoglycoside phosphotransferase (APT) family kinase protein
MGQGHEEPDTARLAAWMSANVPGFAGPPVLSRLAGGQSNPTWVVATPAADYVLRQKPVGATLPSAHAVDREFRVQSALAATGVPVPRMLAFCDDPAVIGSIFYVMERVPGRVLFDPTLPGLTTDDRRAVFAAMGATAAAIHAVDPVAVGLGDYGRPGGYVERQVARWTRQYRASETGPIPEMDALIAWLPGRVADSGDSRLVHGDFRLDNLILHPTEPRVVAVLDWELSTLGDPVSDFAYHVMTWRIPTGLFRGLAGADLARLGIPSEAEYLAAWCAATGRPVPQDWEFHIVLSLFRLAAIIQGIARRARDGTANDPRAAELGARARPLAELAWSLAQAIGR